MRAPFIPTERVDISLALGALVPLLLLFLSMWLPVGVGGRILLVSPFLCGFVASLAFGAVKTSRIRDLFLVGAFAFGIFYFLIWISGYCLMLLFGMSLLSREDSGVLFVFLYVFLHPLVFLAAALLSVVGTIFGWLAALAIRR